MDLARQQSALAFELRAGLELARIWIGRDEVKRAYDLIAPIYSRFSEGFWTPDLVMARELLGQTGRRLTSNSSADPHRSYQSTLA
jgi:predicted ATPase